MTYQNYLHNVILECLGKLQAKPLNEGFNPRSFIPKVRGGWNKDKILRYLKSTSSNYGNGTAAKFIAEFDSINELKEHIFWHGSPWWQSNLKPSITKSERWAGQYGGGGYGQRYWGISLTANKYTATHFAGTRPGVHVHPVVLAKNAVVKELNNIEDAYDVEDLIVQLYTDGIDAVWVGPKGKGEQELLVINPRCICNMDAAQYYECYQLFKDKVPMPTDQQYEELLQASKDYVKGLKTAPRKPSKPLKPLQPSRFYLNGDNPFTRKSDDDYNKEVEDYQKQLSDYETGLQDYERRLQDYNDSDELKAWEKQKQNLRSKMRI